MGDASRLGWKVLIPLAEQIVRRSLGVDMRTPNDSRACGYKATRFGLVLMLAGLTTVILGAQVGLAYEQQVRALATQMIQSISKSGKKTVAVVDFTDLQGNVTELGRFLAEEFSVALAGEAKVFEVIDRTHLKAILQEHKLASTGVIDPLTARKLGQIAGVDALVTGSLTPFGESVRLSAKVLDTSTARMIGAFTTDIPKTKAIDELLAKGIGGGSSPGPGAEPAPPGPKPAPITTAQLGDFVVALRACKHTGETVTCSGSVTNKGLRRNQLVNSSGTYAVDNLGNQSRRSEVVLGVQHWEAELEPEIPTSFSISAEGIAAEATSISLVISYYPGGGNWQKIALRNIRLLGR